MPQQFMTPNPESEALRAREPVRNIGLFLEEPEQKACHRESVRRKGCQTSENPGGGKKKNTYLVSFPSLDVILCHSIHCL